MPRSYTIVRCDEQPSYRYVLEVQTANQTTRVVAVVQLNPSDADSTKSDPTIGKVSIWAAQNQFGRVLFVNLFAVRSQYPTSLVGRPYLWLVGCRNDAACAAALQQADTIIFAWGDFDPSLHPHYRKRVIDLRKIIGSRAIHAVGAPTAAGRPRHGLMWNSPNRTLRKLSWSSL